MAARCGEGGVPCDGSAGEVGRDEGTTEDGTEAVVGPRWQFGLLAAPWVVVGEDAP
mgnify:CR=1 FL=1